MRGNQFCDHQCSASDSAGAFFSSSPDLSPGPEWTPPAIQEINADEYETATKLGQVLQQLPSKAAMEVMYQKTYRNPESGRSTTSCYYSSDSEPKLKPCLSTHCNFLGHRSLLSKPIHPLFFPTQAEGDASETPSTGTSEFHAASLQRDVHCWSSASSSKDFTDIYDTFESESLSQSCSSDGFRCGLCEKLLSQRSPWSSQRIVRSGDMPVAGVLSCCHVFHAECLEQGSPKEYKSNPPCPKCIKLEGRNSTELQGFQRVRNDFPTLRPFSEYGSSRPWGHVPIGDCVEVASHPPKRNTMSLLNRHAMKKNLSFRVTLARNFQGS
ncbi:conserved hypothetical protein [Ricinus communis]|uniref:RING-type domain-containing protein n=1 Tax=Ricinus communis TaxID=3988 RepID=B9S8Y9_RICCO|nr:conserved hypothetical protein [Ricinus communis]